MARRALFCCILLTACASPVQELPYEEQYELAAQEARETFPEFVEAFQHPDETRTFAAIKVRFAGLDGSMQDIWVDDLVYKEGRFTGAVGDDLPNLRLELGEVIPVSLEDMVDWMIVEHEKLIGGYTIRLSYKYMTSEERQAFLDTAGYVVEE